LSIKKRRRSNGPSNSGSLIWYEVLFKSVEFLAGENEDPVIKKNETSQKYGNILF
ncbi:MAG: hypothetical protein HW396_1039, partial [Candidatus Dadabacteria bacterium]|nr:hypothetical protein [Candidatus Dadabacteria bacterium]